MRVERNAERIDEGWVVRVVVPALFQMPQFFPELTATQVRFVTVMIEESRTEDGEYFASWTHNSLWTLRFSRFHSGGKKIGGFQETDLVALKDEGYITLIQPGGRDNRYEMALKPRAESQYRRLFEFDFTALDQTPPRIGF